MRTITPGGAESTNGAKFKMLVTPALTNRSAASWWEDGPFAVTAEDVEKLGQNVAVWGMGNFGATMPGGLIKHTVTVPTIPLSSGRRSSSTTSK